MQGVESSPLEEIQKLLLRGKREEAVECAVAEKQYALALLIASVCDHSTYYAVARCFVDKALPSGTPLHTVAALFADQIQISDDDVDTPASDFWRDSTENLYSSWRSHLASILSNQTEGWKKIVISLGDQLRSQGKIHAAHFCYLISGYAITSYNNPSSRLVLLGCDHTLDIHQTLTTLDSLEGYERLEALEWAKRKGNPHAVISTLQPLKLKYASILADHGFEKAAKAYVDSIRKCTGIENAQEFDSSTTPYSSEFVEALDILEDRLCDSMGLPNEMKNSKSKKSISLPSVFSNLLGGGTSKKKESDSKVPAPEQVVDVANESTIEDETHNISFVSATSNLLDTTAKSHQNTVQASGQNLQFTSPQPNKVSDANYAAFQSPASTVKNEPKKTFPAYQSPDFSKNAPEKEEPKNISTATPLFSPYKPPAAKQINSDNQEKNPSIEFNKPTPAMNNPLHKGPNPVEQISSAQPKDPKRAPNSAPIKSISNSEPTTSAPKSSPVKPQKEEAPNSGE